MQSSSLLKINRKVRINATNHSDIIIKDFDTYLYSISQSSDGTFCLQTWHGTLDVTEPANLFHEDFDQPTMITSENITLTIGYVAEP